MYIEKARFYKNMFLSFIMIALFSACSQPQEIKQVDMNATMINIHGKSDKRLKLFFISTYRPRGLSLPPECLSKTLDWNTAGQKSILKFEGVSVVGKDEYNIKIPVYNIDLRSKCTYEFVGISVRVRRMYDDELYANIPILTDVPIFISEGYGSGQAGSQGNNTNIIKTKKYFRIPNNTKVSCFTEEFEKKDLTTNFICRLNQREINSSIDVIKDESIKLDIDVNKSLCRFLFKGRELSIYKHKKGLHSKEQDALWLSKQWQFKEAEKPFHTAILEKLQNLKKLITGEDHE